MAAYNWIVIIFSVLCYGLLYGATYDVISNMHDSAYVGDTEAQTGVNIVWLAWKYSPVAVLFAALLYGYMAGQKPSGGRY